MALLQFSACIKIIMSNNRNIRQQLHSEARRSSSQAAYQALYGQQSDLRQVRGRIEGQLDDSMELEEEARFLGGSLQKRGLSEARQVRHQQTIKVSENELLLRLNQQGYNNRVNFSQIPSPQYSPDSQQRYGQLCKGDLSQKDKKIEEIYQKLEQKNKTIFQLQLQLKNQDQMAFIKAQGLRATFESASRFRRQNEIQKLQSLVKEKNAIMKQLTLKNNRYKGQLETVLKQLQRQRQKLKQKQRLEWKIKEMTEQIILVKNMGLERLNKQKQLKNNYKSIQQQNKFLKTKLRMFDEQFASNQKRQQKQRENARKQIQTLRKTKIKSQEQTKRIQSLLELQLKQRQSIRKDHKNIQEIFKFDKNQFQILIRDLKEQLNTKKIREEKLLSQKDQSKRLINKVKEELQDSIEKNEALTSKTSQLERMIRHCRVQLEQSQQRQQRLVSQNIQQERVANNMKKQLEESKNKQIALKSERQQEQALIKKLKGLLNQFQCRQYELNQEVRKLKHQIINSKKQQIILQQSNMRRQNGLNQQIRSDAHEKLALGSQLRLAQLQLKKKDQIIQRYRRSSS